MLISEHEGFDLGVKTFSWGMCKHQWGTKGEKKIQTSIRPVGSAEFQSHSILFGKWYPELFIISHLRYYFWFSAARSTRSIRPIFFFFSFKITNFLFRQVKSSSSAEGKSSNNYRVYTYFFPSRSIHKINSDFGGYPFFRLILII